MSPTRGRLTFEQLFQDLIGYVCQDPEAHYRLIIGTDSQAREETTFVTAIIIHRAGKGARYYYSREQSRSVRSFRQRIFYETAKSLEVAGRLAAKLSENGQSDLDIEIHLDVGENGPSRDLIREVVGMVTGSGFEALIKPNSYGASKVADKYTK
ncbi:MAG: ribonuclease H-like YkuK family protein [Bacillota bacterium]|nr:ribonuclease H-like YkuK family protein [Bacillota bacterium]